jgi:hypothetical protein
MTEWRPEVNAIGSASGHIIGHEDQAPSKGKSGARVNSAFPIANASEPNSFFQFPSSCPYCEEYRYPSIDKLHPVAFRSKPCRHSSQPCAIYALKVAPTKPMTPVATSYGRPA